MENFQAGIHIRTLYKYYAYIREAISFYFQKLLPIIKLIQFDGPILEMDEVFLGAKKKDPRGRNPAISQIVFG